MKLSGWDMSNEEKGNEKIVLPKKLQADMLQFFMRTSIPRKMIKEQEAKNSLSEKSDRS